MKTMEKNINKVPKKQWLKWSKLARKSFNKMYEFFYYNQSIATHPKTRKLPDEEWKTIAWNAAWIAADVVDDTVPDGIVTINKNETL